MRYSRLGIPLSSSSREVVREAHRLLSPHARKATLREKRKEWIRALLAEHRQALLTSKQFPLAKRA